MKWIEKKRQFFLNEIVYYQTFTILANGLLCPGWGCSNYIPSYL